jgi:hypothetical protein
VEIKDLYTHPHPPPPAQATTCQREMKIGEIKMGKEERLRDIGTECKRLNLNIIGKALV